MRELDYILIVLSCVDGLLANLTARLAIELDCTKRTLHSKIESTLRGKFTKTETPKHAKVSLQSYQTATRLSPWGSGVPESREVMTDLCTPVDLFMGFAGLVTKLAKCLHHTACVTGQMHECSRTNDLNTTRKYRTAHWVTSWKTF